VLLVIFALKQVAQDGISWLSALALVAGLVVGAVFARRQQTVADPLVDLHLFRMPAFSAALAVNLLGLLAFDGAVLFIAQYLQLVAGLSPWHAALWTLPWAAGLIVGSMVGPLLVRWVSPRVAITSALAMAAVGFGLLTQVGSASALVVAAIASVIFSLGLTPAVALATDLIVGTAPPERAGVASGMSETSTELGGALGIALVGSIGVAVYRSQIVLPSSVPAGTAAAARNTLGGALAVADQLSAADGNLLRTAARLAFTDGLRVAGLTSAAIVLGVALIAWLALRNSPAAV
jgi:DHA2 family multidrug resistance protein-like MFS transporter